MKNTSKYLHRLEYVAAGKNRFKFHSSFYKKDIIIKNLEIIIMCIVAFIAGIGIYNTTQ